MYALCLFSYSTIFISSCTSIFHFKQDPIPCCMLNIYFQRYAWFLRVFMYFPMRFVSVCHCTHCVCFPMTIRGYFLHMLYLFPTVRLYGCSVPVYVFHVYFPLYICMAVQFHCTYVMCVSHCTPLWLLSSTVRFMTISQKRDCSVISFFPGQEQTSDKQTAGATTRKFQTQRECFKACFE